jgi:hypothetical protein
VDGLPRGWRAEAAHGGDLEVLFELARAVYHGSACDLPGVPIRYDIFIPALWRAVQTGHVDPETAETVSRWMRWGVEVGLDINKIHGKREYKNYPSATGEYRSRVRAATQERVASGRTHLSCLSLPLS